MQTYVFDLNPRDHDADCTEQCPVVGEHLHGVLYLLYFFMFYLQKSSFLSSNYPSNYAY